MDDRIKLIADIDTLVKLRFDYISTEIELSAEDKVKLEPKLREYFKNMYRKKISPLMRWRLTARLFRWLF